MNAPVVMKMNRRYPEPDNIDIECEEPILYPASRLYELSDKNESGHEVENAYKEMDMFPY